MTSPAMRRSAVGAALRHHGDQGAAQTLLTEIGVRWPGFSEAHAALADPTYGLRFTDAATIDTCTDY